MTSGDSILPTLILPYPGPSDREDEQDIFVYLRPETNGVLAESTILKIVKEANVNQASIKLVFLANFPGEFIVGKHIVEQYYAVKLHFAVSGKAAFTESMKERFSNWFGIRFEDAPIVGAFEALEILNLEPEQLFDTWVENHNVCIASGQNVKHYGDLFIVNYDIPALIHKNSKNTDIAVMIFRTSMNYVDFKQLVERMHDALCLNGILNPRFDAARAFHYSKGPFEQIKDGVTYLGSDERLGLKLSDLTFMRYLAARGISEDQVRQVLLNPIVYVRNEETLREEYIHQYTQFDSFQNAYHKFLNIESTAEIIHHSPLIVGKDTGAKNGQG